MTPRAIIVGGGLSGGLTAIALAESGWGGAVTLVEGSDRLGGDHTWSFHETDLQPDEHAFIAPFVSWRWPQQEVNFPGYRRMLSVGYQAVTSDGFDRVARERLARAGCEIFWRARVTHVDAHDIRLAGGSTLTADTVIDARGPQAPAGPGGFQKFLGLELELETDGPWAVPVVMDATVPQLDGYRFIYVLPFTRRRVLIEDTMYADGPALDLSAVERRVLDYAALRGARVARVLRRESGVLPLPFRGEAAPAELGRGPLRIGYRGGFFHPVTGYSLPLAVRVARAFARSKSAGDMAQVAARLSRSLAPQRRLGHLLNRLLFGAMEPDQRWRALDRFYRLPDATIARFYGSRTTALDRLRLLVGRPPAGLSWRRWMRGPEVAA